MVDNQVEHNFTPILLFFVFLRDLRAFVVKLPYMCTLEEF